MANFHLDFVMIEMIVKVNNGRLACSHMEIMLDLFLGTLDCHDRFLVEP